MSRLFRETAQGQRDASRVDEMIERRREQRYSIPDIYREYIVFKTRYSGGDYTVSELAGFSRHGIKIVKHPDFIACSTIIECLISVPRSLVKEIAFKAAVRYCSNDVIDGGHQICAEIIDIPDELWFSVLVKVLEFIDQRAGTVF